MKKIRRDHRGFTLVELMIAIAVFAIVMTGVYSVYSAQMRTHYTQQQAIDLQQNIRSALYLMEREIKMAGLNPTGADGIGISRADDHVLAFNMDFTGGYCDGDDDDGDGTADEGCDGDPSDINTDNNGNGLYDESDEAEWYDGDANDPNEQVVYALSNDGIDADSDGAPDNDADSHSGINDGLPTENDDGSSCNLLRNDEILALNIDAVNFVYLDEDAAVLATPVADTSQIRTIQVALVARSSAAPSNFFSDRKDTQEYRNQQGTVILPAQDDTFRRMLMTMEVTCRNNSL